MKTKGLSTIVATLIIILLTLVAIGIIWVVVKNVIQGGTEQIGTNSKCLDTQIAATKVTNVSTDYNVTLSRTSGNDEIGGIKLIFTNSNATSNFVKDIPGNIETLGTKTVTVSILPADLANPEKVSVAVYFKDSSGNEQLCTASGEFEF